MNLDGRVDDLFVNSHTLADIVRGQRGIVRDHGECARISTRIDFRSAYAFSFWSEAKLRASTQQRRYAQQRED